MDLRCLLFLQVYMHIVDVCDGKLEGWRQNGVPFKHHHPKEDEEAMRFGEVAVVNEMVTTRVQVPNRKTSIQ